MEDPADGIIYDFVFGECLMTAFVSDNPEARCGEANDETIGCPEGNAKEGVQEGV